MRLSPIAASSAALLLIVSLTPRAHAQFPGAAGGGGGRPGQSAPTQSSPTQQIQPGPRNTPDDSEDGAPQVTQRGEPTVAVPANPLEISKEARDQIGSDYSGGPLPPNPDAPSHYSFFPYYQESKGDYRFRTLPPFWFEETRGIDPLHPEKQDRQSLYGLLYYQRRSPDYDRDIFFPAFWRLRDHDTSTVVAGPFVHREAPGEHDNWLAPLYFTGTRPDGGYVHLPLLLTTTHWNAKKAFTYSLLYYRDRTGADIDSGVIPFYFHGDNGDTEGSHRTYTLIPPLLYFHREREVDQSSMTVIGPVIQQSDAKRDVFDVAPLFFHIKGKPDSGGIDEEHTTLFPFFHYGHAEDKTLFVVPGYLRRTTKDADTMITPFFSRATTRNGATSMTVAGPVVPLFFNYFDRDVGTHAFAAAPFYYQSDSPVGHDWLTPLAGHFETYGISQTWWIFPTFTAETDTKGWSANLYPFFFMGRDQDSSHTVIAPIFWDFANKESRTTVGFPVFWRFATAADQSITQVALNTVYVQKHVQGGLDWQFHFAPFFSYGENPQGYFWNVLFGLAGYTRAGSYAQGRAFWIPFTLAGDAPK